MIILSNIWPVTVEGWVGLLTIFVGLVGAIIALIPTIVKLGKTLKELVKNKNFKKITEIALKAIKSAEATGASGANKKEMVINAVKAACVEAGIEIDDDTLNEVSQYIDNMISYFNDMEKVSNAKGDNK